MESPIGPIQPLDMESPIDPLHMCDNVASNRVPIRISTRENDDPFSKVRYCSFKSRPDSHKHMGKLWTRANRPLARPSPTLKNTHGASARAQASKKGCPKRERERPEFVKGARARAPHASNTYFTGAQNAMPVHRIVHFRGLNMENIFAW